MSAEPSSRVFFALWPDAAMQTALADATRSIALSVQGARATGAADNRTGNTASRLVPSSNFHLTLVFLGAIPQSRIPALSPIAAQLAESFPLNGSPIDVTLDRVEYWSKAQLLCATASATPAAAIALSEALKSALRAEGFTPDLKPFRAHATFARKVRHVTCELSISPVLWSFRDFHLVESRSDPGGSIYSSREKWLLDKRAC